MIVFTFEPVLPVPALIINSCNICGVFNAILDAVKAKTKCPPFNNKIANQRKKSGGRNPVN